MRRWRREGFECVLMNRGMFLSVVPSTWTDIEVRKSTRRKTKGQQAESGSG